MSLLGTVDPAEFLARYWQKRPLVLRGTVDPSLVAISPEELAGFALEEEIESRLITEDPATGKWQLQHGPLDEADFGRLPESHWTLLVQSLDYFYPGLDSLIDACDFLPRWRLDDVMVSFATRGGGVGPHVDRYDVFLVQVQGRRRWRIGDTDTDTTACLPHPEISQIPPFEPILDLIAEPGDVLYVPPGVPHWGVALDDSITCSVGFRAPSARDLVLSWADELGHRENCQQALYSDCDTLIGDSARDLLPDNLLRWAGQHLSQAATDAELSALALGKLVTRLKYPEFAEAEEEISGEDLLTALAGGAVLRHRHPGRACMTVGDTAYLFVNGAAIRVTPALAPLAKLIVERQALGQEHIAPWLADPEALLLIRFACNLNYFHISV